MRAIRLLVALVAVFSAASCVSFNIVRFRQGEPVAEAVLARFHPGQTTFGDCLRLLGAPRLVWPSEAGRVMIAYAWQDQIDWGVDVSWAFDQALDLKFEFDSVHVDVEGLVLLFDSQLNLLDVERGFLRDFLPSAQETSGGARLRRAPY